MAKKKKKNPLLRPASVADVMKAKKDAQDRAINITWAIFFSVMRDKEGYGRKRLARLWERVQELSDSIVKGYVSVDDLMQTLRDEAGINLKR